jgi:hypothetical protein
MTWNCSLLAQPYNMTALHVNNTLHKANRAEIVACPARMQLLTTLLLGCRMQAAVAVQSHL